MRYLLLIVLLVPAAFQTMAQETPAEPPYQRFPTVPPFRILLQDSTTYYEKDDLPKKKSVLVMLFSPDCDHCQHQTEDIIKNIRNLSSVQIVMATVLPFSKVKEFYEKYSLHLYPNIVVGKDVNYLLPDFFGAHTLPVLGLYNKKKSLIMVSAGTMPVEAILQKFSTQ